MIYKTYIDLGLIGEVDCEVEFSGRPASHGLFHIELINVTAMIDDQEVNILPLLSVRGINVLEDECMGEMI